MRQTVRLGRVWGIPVGMHWSVLVVMLLLVQGLAGALLPQAVDGHSATGYWLAAGGFIGLLMGALLAHELAHAVVARHYGVRVRSVTLWLLGGISELDGEPPHPRAALGIALAGPLASLGAAAIFAGGALVTALAGAELPTIGLVWLAVVNALMAVFNLLPGSPLDGGRVLAAVIWRARGDRALAQRAAARAGVVLGVVMAGAGLVIALTFGSLSGLWLVLIGWYLAGTARSEASAVRLTRALAGVTVGQVMSTPAVCGYIGQSLAVFIAGTAASGPHRAYPVADLDGRLVGLVTVSSLAAVPAGRRGEVRLADILIPVSQVRVVQPSTPLIEAAKLLTDPRRPAVVVADDRPCGVLSPGDLIRALSIADLGGRPDRTRGGLSEPHFVPD